MNNTNKSYSPLISVITVTFNAAQFIEQSLASIASQCDADFELIIIDGGSDDGTVDIIKKYQPSIFYWHSRPDRGLTHAFNIGIEKSRGKWLIFINSDDFLVDSNVLLSASKYLLKSPEADVIYGNVLVVNRGDDALIVGGPYGKKFSWIRHLINNKIPHQGAFISRDYFNAVGLYDESYLIGADYELFLRKKSKLNAIFIPLLISKMRDGGLSKINQSLCNEEWHAGRVKNRVLRVYILFLLKILIAIKLKSGSILKRFKYS